MTQISGAEIRSRWLHAGRGQVVLMRGTGRLWRLTCDVLRPGVAIKALVSLVGFEVD